MKRSADIFVILILLLILGVILKIGLLNPDFQVRTISARMSVSVIRTDALIPESIPQVFIFYTHSFFPGNNVTLAAHKTITIPVSTSYGASRIPVTVNPVRNRSLGYHLHKIPGNKPDSEALFA